MYYQVSTEYIWTSNERFSAQYEFFRTRSESQIWVQNEVRVVSNVLNANNRCYKLFQINLN